MPRTFKLMRRWSMLVARRQQRGRSATGAVAGGGWRGIESLEARVLLSQSLPAWLIDGPLGDTSVTVATTTQPEAPAPTSADSTLAFYLPPQRRLQQPGGFLSQPRAGDPLQIALEFLAEHAADLGLRPEDLAEHRVSSQYTDAASGATHIDLRQLRQGLEIAHADLGIHLNARGQVVSVNSRFIRGGSEAQDAAPAASLNAARAYAALSAAFDLGFSSVSQLIERVDSADGSSVVVTHVGANLEVPASLVYVPVPAGLELAWRINVPSADQAHWFDACVDADSGQLLHVTDWAQNASYHVYPMPVESPDDGGRAVVTDPFDPVASPFGWHDGDGLVGPEYFDTRGNNVWAQEDLDHDDLAGFRPSGGPALNFDFPLDLAQDPTTYPSAAITNLFYWTNLLHDIHYRYGFTEAAGNFQINNYGRGGTGGDPLLADAQDGDAVNNGLMITPPDGQSPRMQVYLFNRSTPRRDGVLDSSLVIHEYGHGVARRLTGGPANSSSLDALQSAAMSEGWSDWYSLMLTQVPTDGKLDAYAVGAYAYNIADGVRRQPYSFDMTVNPLTFDDFNGGLPHNESHNAGEIWCSVLWDLNWLLIEKYGYTSDLIHGNAGNTLALQLVMDALKLQGANPSFLAGRDAVLAADVALSGGANQAEIWTAFARRGMGFSASDGGNANAFTVTEAFDLPPLGAISGNVFRDDDGNGLRSGTEPGLPGWTVYRDINLNGVLDQATTTATFHSTDTPRAVADRATSYSNLAIAGLPGVVADINVKVNLTHPYDGEMYLTLLSPGNTPVILSNYQGGSGDNFTNTVFDDEASVAIASGAAPFTGSFRPHFALSLLDNINPNGTWKLRMDDAVAGNVGTLLDWSLEISYFATEPSTTTDAQGNYTFSNLSDGSYRVRQVSEAGYALTAPVGGAHDVVIAAGQPIVGRHFANQSTLASATPGTPDLVDAGDTGVSSSDDLTRLDNSAPGQALTFVVPGTVSGALVQLWAGEVLIGSATASGPNTTITSNGTVDLADGVHLITARQTEAGLAASNASSPLSLRVDTQGPTVTVNQASVQPDPTSAASIYFTAVFAEAVFGLDSGDVTLSGTAGATTAQLGSGSTTFNFVVNGMSQPGTVVASLAADVATDAAGNGNQASTSTDNTVTFGNPTPEISVSGGGFDIADGDATPSATDGTSFGSASQGAAYVERTFVVSNSGTGTLTLGEVALPAGFVLGSDLLAFTLAPGDSDTFTVRLNTAAAGVFAGDLSFNNDDGDENPFQFRITGTVDALVNTKPTIASITDSPDPVVQGKTLTLTANSVADADPGDAVTLVEFYRDANGNNVLDPAGDTLLGADIDGSNGWSWSGSTAALPAGTNRYFARASDGSLWSSSVTATGVVNIAPSLGGLAVAPSLAVKGDSITITASGVSDASPGSVTAVEFYRDANGNGALDIGTDVSLGSDTSSSGGWNKVVSTSTFPLGQVTLLARTRDNLNAYSAPAAATVFINAKPTVGGLTDSPDPLVPGNVLALTASSVADSDGIIALVEFYRDVNGNSLIDAGVDQWLGSDATSSGGWSLVAPAQITATFPAGSARYLARAQDNLGAWSAARVTLGVVSNPPVVATLTASPAIVHKGSTLTLTAGGVSDPDAGQSVASVAFYRDTNNSGVWESTDALMGTDSSSSGGWSWSGSTSSFPVGSVRFFARARDNTGVYASAPPAVVVLVNALPTIGSLTDTPDPLVRGAALTLKAGTVADADGTVGRIEFYRDLNNNSLIDPALDQLLGTDDIAADGWSVLAPGEVTAGFVAGTVRYMARAQDNQGGWSAARVATGVAS